MFDERSYYVVTIVIYHIVNNKLDQEIIEYKGKKLRN